MIGKHFDQAACLNVGGEAKHGASILIRPCNPPFSASRHAQKNFAPLPLPARLDSGKAPAYFSATLALALGEC
ncbi:MULTISPECIES: hypothetical protein [unclassified Mesorhizobium]|uniref:hypothetical protein n=1 Tax=unclassified Mesorhizobium TaxID=325217 RepID=UPI0016746DD0|nr:MULTISPECIES: hypothetical protein [unclassified Mesorhizobium]